MSTKKSTESDEKEANERLLPTEAPIANAKIILPRPLDYRIPWQNLANPHFVPTDQDILCGRGRGNLHEGNMRYLAILQQNLHLYISANKRIQKNAVVRSIVALLRGEGSRFLKQEDTSHRWCELSDSEAYDRTAHAIRDLIRKQKSKNKKSSPKQSSAVMSEKNTLDTTIEALPALSISGVAKAETVVGLDMPRSAKPVDPVDYSGTEVVQPRITKIPGIEQQKKTSPSFDIFFELGSQNFRQILMEVDGENTVKKPPPQDGSK